MGEAALGAGRLGGARPTEGPESMFACSETRLIVASLRGQYSRVSSPERRRAEPEAALPMRSQPGALPAFS